VKPNLYRAWILLIITLALPLALAILAILSRVTHATDTAFSFLLLCTVSLYVSLAAGLLVPVWIGVVWFFGGGVERRTVFLLLSLSFLNIAVAIAWLGLFVPQLHFRY
jgi:hypothetical protein